MTGFVFSQPQSIYVLSPDVKYILTNGISNNSNYYGYEYDANYYMHGVFTSASKTYTYDFPGAYNYPGYGTAITYAEVNKIDNTTILVGNYKDSSGLYHSWSAHGIYPSLVDTSAFGDIPAGKFGTYTYGMVTQPDVKFSDGYHYTFGYFIDAKAQMHGFIASSGAYSQIDQSGATGTAITSVAYGKQGGALSGQQIYTGFYVDSNSKYHGFVDTPDGNHDILVKTPNSAVIPLAINSDGLIVGAFQDANGWHGFATDLAGNETIFNYPNASLTALTGINDAKVVTGVTTTHTGDNVSFMTQLSLV